MILATSHCHSVKRKKLKYNVKTRKKRKLKHKLHLEKCALPRITGKKQVFLPWEGIQILPL